jgi:hypothetical protein
LKKKVPQMAASIQVINHTGQNYCEPQYDSFLTLFKPSTCEVFLMSQKPLFLKGLK